MTQLDTEDTFCRGPHNTAGNAGHQLSIPHDDGESVIRPPLLQAEPTLPHFLELATKPDRPFARHKERLWK